MEYVPYIGSSAGERRGGGTRLVVRTGVPRANPPVASRAQEDLAKVIFKFYYLTRLVSKGLLTCPR